MRGIKLGSREVAMVGGGLTRIFQQNPTRNALKEYIFVRRKRIMHCPSCRAKCTAEETYCQRCGADLMVHSKSLVPAQQRLPAVLYNPQIPRVAAGVGALALGVGIELLRRGLLARLARPARASAKLLPAISPSSVREIFSPSEEKKHARLPKGYEIHETMVYMSRVLRRKE